MLSSATSSILIPDCHYLHFKLLVSLLRNFMDVKKTCHSLNLSSCTVYGIENFVMCHHSNELSVNFIKSVLRAIILLKLESVTGF